MTIMLNGKKMIGYTGKSNHSEPGSRVGSEHTTSMMITDDERGEIPDGK